MLSNAYFLAKFRFDTAENEPAKNCKICEYLENRAAHPIEDERVLPGGHRVEVRRLRPRGVRGLAHRRVEVNLRCH